MTKNLHRSLATALAVLGAGFMASPPARAQWAVECVNCSTVFSQATQVAKEIETAETTAQQLQTQIQQYQNMLTQGISLPNSMFSRMTGDLQRLQSLYQNSQSMAGQLSNFDQNFRNRFTDYNSYLNKTGKSPTYMADNYKQWSQDGFNNARTAMEAAGMNVNDIPNEDAVLSRLVQQSQSAKGRMQAIQAGNQIAAQQVQQLQKLRQMENARIQAQGNWYAQAIERQAVSDAAAQSFQSGRVANDTPKSF